MPILPPEPGKILDELRAVEARLRELAARPGDVLVEVALGSVAVAVMALAAHVSPPSAAS